MADSFLVRIDLAKFQENASGVGDEMTLAEVREWLKDNHFQEREDGFWLCEELTLTLLNPSEILEKRRF